MEQLWEMFCIFVSSTTTQKYIIILVSYVDLVTQYRALIGR
jgi:hypothetical protein